MTETGTVDVTLVGGPDDGAVISVALPCRFIRTGSGTYGVVSRAGGEHVALHNHIPSTTQATLR